MLQLVTHVQLREVAFDFLHFNDQLNLRLVHHSVRQSVEQFAFELCQEWFRIYRSDPFADRGDRLQRASGYLAMHVARPQCALRFAHHTEHIAAYGARTGDSATDRRRKN